MAIGSRSVAALEQIRRLFHGGTGTGLTEAELLRRFAEGRDEAAFAALVDRHGPMVVGVLRRRLADPNDADDAFQATFLVLARRARSLGPGVAVGPWLHGVADRVALRSLSAAARRRNRERPVEAIEAVAVRPESPVPDHDLGGILDEEVRRLRASERAAVVLCLLEGRTHEQAARELGWPVGTLKGRLARARERLRGRLTRRGVTPAAFGAGLLALTGREALAVVPAGWAGRAVRAAIQSTTGGSAVGIVSTAAVTLSEGVTGAMFAAQLKTAVAGLAVLAAAVAAGAGVYARQQGGDGPPAAAKTAEASAAPGKPADATPRGAAPDAESPGLQAVREAYDLALQEFKEGRLGSETVQLWSRRLMEREDDARDATRHKDALARHAKRMIQVEQIARSLDDPEGGRKPAAVLEALNARYGRLQADDLLIAAGAPQVGGPPSTVKPPSPTPPPKRVAIEIGSDDGPKPGQLLVRLRVAGDGNDPLPGRDPRSLAVLKTLDEPVAMKFPNETPLEDILKYLREATRGANGGGLQIYVDPVGLQEAEKTLTSPVSIDLEGIPLRRTLQLLLAQIGMVYKVEDGILFITASGSGNAKLEPPMVTPSPLMQMQERAERGEMTAAERKAFIEMLKDLAEIDKLLHPPQPKNPGGFQ